MVQVTLSSLVGELSTAAQQAGLPQDLVDRIPQYVSAGNIEIILTLAAYFLQNILYEYSHTITRKNK